MKNLSVFIKESLQNISEEYHNIILHDVTVKYGIEGQDVVIEQPEDYLEDNIMIYLGDTLGSKLWTNEEYAKDFFGKNSDNIIDTYFEWSGYDDTTDIIDINFDKHYGNGLSDDKKLRRVKYKNFYYVVKFSSFEIQNDDETDIKEVLQKIFDRPVSDQYKWPLKFELNYNDIEYK